MVVITSFTLPFLKIFHSIMTNVRLLVNQHQLGFKIINNTMSFFRFEDLKFTFRNIEDVYLYKIL